MFTHSLNDFDGINTKTFIIDEVKLSVLVLKRIINDYKMYLKKESHIHHFFKLFDGDNALVKIECLLNNIAKHRTPIKFFMSLFI